MRTRFFLIFSLAALLTGCTSTEAPSLKASPVYVAKYNALSALDVVAALESNVTNAKESDMEFLAPQYYIDAAKILGECQSALGNKPKSVLVNSAAKADALLEKGRTLIPIVKYRFAKELAFKTQMEAHNAPRLLAKDYEKTISDLAKLIKKIELEQTDSIDKEKETLLKTMQELVIKSVQENALHESEAINNASKKNNADKLSPLTYGQALKLFQDAKNKIANAYLDSNLVQQVSADALFAARHAQQVNARVTLLYAQLNPSTHSNGITVEQIILQEETRLFAIALSFGLNDLRDQSLEKQVDEIKHAAEVARLGNTATGKTTAAPNCEALLLDTTNAKNASLAALSAKDQQLEALSQQLADKDSQLKMLTEKVDESKNQTAVLTEKYQQIEILKAKVIELESAAQTASKPAMKVKVNRVKSSAE
ncbi:MAG: hypothetical protein Q8O24_09235 [Gallionellaceae bacterium]|nr:hypothetical protein [Gallionellaceae bacterium]